MTGWEIVWILGIVLVADVTIRGIGLYFILPIFDRKLTFDVDPFSPDPTAEQVSIPSTGTLQLAGAIYRAASQPARGVIVFCPEFGGDRWSAGFYAAGLRKAGFDVLAFDFRNQGQSDCQPDYDPRHWLTEYEVDDTLAAVNYARQRAEWRMLPIGLFGISRGGGAALVAAARSRDVEAVACEGTYSTRNLMLFYTLRWASLYVPPWLLKCSPVWHLAGTLTMVRWMSQRRRNCSYADIEQALVALRAKPSLFIAGERDSYVSCELSNDLAKLAGNSGAWIVPEARHNRCRHLALAEYDSRLVEFFGAVAPLPVTEHTTADVASREPAAPSH